MEKIKFMFDDGEQSVEFFVLEETKINGVSYILVTDSEDEDGECMILKDTNMLYNGKIRRKLTM